MLPRRATQEVVEVGVAVEDEEKVVVEEAGEIMMERKIRDPQAHMDKTLARSKLVTGVDVRGTGLGRAGLPNTQ